MSSRTKSSDRHDRRRDDERTRTESGGYVVDAGRRNGTKSDGYFQRICRVKTP